MSAKWPGPGRWTKGASSRLWEFDVESRLGMYGIWDMKIENDEVIQPHRGDQGQVGGPQVPLPGHVE